jgi:hypothetical protein
VAVTEVIKDFRLVLAVQVVEEMEELLMVPRQLLELVTRVQLALEAVAAEVVQASQTLPFALGKVVLVVLVVGV